MKVKDNVNYERAYVDLYNIYIDQLTPEGEDIVYVSDLKSVMEEILLDYKY